MLWVRIPLAFYTFRLDFLYFVAPGAVSLTALSSTPTNGSEEIDHEELRRFASSVDAEVMSTSARSGKGVCELFLKVISGVDVLSWMYAYGTRTQLQSQ